MTVSAEYSAIPLPTGQVCEICSISVICEKVLQNLAQTNKASALYRKLLFKASAWIHL